MKAGPLELSRESIEAERQEMRRTSADMKRELQQTRLRVEQFLARLRAKAESIEREPPVKLVKVKP